MLAVMLAKQRVDKSCAAEKSQREHKRLMQMAATQQIEVAVGTTHDLRKSGLRIHTVHTLVNSLFNSYLHRETFADSCRPGERASSSAAGRAAS